MGDPRIMLEKEEQNLSELMGIIKKSNQLSRSMCGILDSFDDHLMKLEQTILPVYQETGNLQRRQENLGSLIDNLDYVIQYYRVAEEVESTIQDGPSASLENFLKSLERLKSAIEFFENSNPTSPELTELSTLFEVGGDKLQSEFRVILTRNSKPVPPVTVLDWLGTDEEIPHGTEKVKSKQLPDNVLCDLIKISSWLSKNRNLDFANVYAAIRSNTLLQSIQNLKDHQRNSSGNSNTLTVQNSPQLGSRRSIAKESTPRRPPKSIQQLVKRTATAVIAKYSPTVESAVLGHRLQTSHLPDPKDEIPECEVMAFMTSISGLLKLMQSESQLMEGIIAEPQQKVVFERIVIPAMESLMSDGESIVGRVKRCVSRHDFTAALNLFPILRHLMSVRSEFESMFQNCTHTVRGKLQELTITLHTTLNKALEEFIESIRKNDSDPKLPKDGTVHELASNAMMLLEQLLEYQDILRDVLILQDTSLSVAKDTGRLAFAQYITRVLTAMGLKLQNKSEGYSDPFLKAIFRINNLHYILKALQRSGLLEIVQLHYPNAGTHYNDQILDQKRIYSQSWSRVLHYVMEVDRPISQQRTAATMSMLKDKDRQNIKDKFTGFNKEMEEIYRIQKAYAIPDVELREGLKRENKNYILPKYQMFYDKYVNIPFTKNPDKYLKYSPLDVSNIMDKFFDASA